MIILASESPYRKNLLNRCHIPFTAVAAKIDEDDLKKYWTNKTPLEMAQSLAKAKAESISLANKDSIIIGSDQLIDFNGKILGKGHNKQDTLKQLLALTGRTHLLITAVCLKHQNGNKEFYNITEITLKKLTKDFLSHYLEFDTPYDCAGGYMIEKSGPVIIESVKTNDPTAIEGLPMMELTSSLNKIGFVW